MAGAVQSGDLLMSSNPQFTAVPRYAAISLSVANPNLDGTGTMGVGGFISGANGSRLEHAVIKAKVATTAGMVRLFISSGAETTLLTEIPVAGVNKGPAVAAFEEIVELNLVIPTGYTVKASTEKGEAINAHLFGGDF